MVKGDGDGWGAWGFMAADERIYDEEERWKGGEEGNTSLCHISFQYNSIVYYENAIARVKANLPSP